MEEQKTKATAWKRVLIILVVLGVGFFTLNQGLKFFYKIEFLKSPCMLCGELNPQVEECIKYMNQERPSYWVNGTWSDPFKEPTGYYVNTSDNQVYTKPETQAGNFTKLNGSIIFTSD